MWGGTKCLPSPSDLTMHGTSEGMWFTGALSYCGGGGGEVQVPFEIVAKSKSHLEDAHKLLNKTTVNDSFAILILLGGRAHQISMFTSQMYAKLCCVQDFKACLATGGAVK